MTVHSVTESAEGRNPPASAASLTGTPRRAGKLDTGAAPASPLARIADHAAVHARRATAQAAIRHDLTGRRDVAAARLADDALALAGELAALCVEWEGLADVS